MDLWRRRCGSHGGGDDVTRRRRIGSSARRAMARDRLGPAFRPCGGFGRPTDDQPSLLLPSLERLRPIRSLRLLIEADTLRHADPGLVSSCALVALPPGGVAPWTDVLAAWTERMERASVVPSPSAARLRATLGALLQHVCMAKRHRKLSSGEAQGEQETERLAPPGACAEPVCRSSSWTAGGDDRGASSSSKGTGGHDEDGALDGTEGAEEGGEGETPTMVAERPRSASRRWTRLHYWLLWSSVASGCPRRHRAGRGEVTRLRSALSSDVLARQLAQLGQPGSSDPPPQSAASSVWRQQTAHPTAHPFTNLAVGGGADWRMALLEECARTARAGAAAAGPDQPSVELFVLDGCAFGLQEVVRLSLSSERPLLPSGPAGCGKTAMLTHRRLSAMAKEDSKGAASNTDPLDPKLRWRDGLGPFLEWQQDGQSTSTSAEALADSITASLAEPIITAAAIASSLAAQRCSSTTYTSRS